MSYVKFNMISERSMFVLTWLKEWIDRN